ncbi:MAG: hypothetical protein OXC80_05445 [Gammaproteobacteria bacterium]|nr:hypothetical protein [Gammaproteobacteria bacterium]
MSSVVTSGAIVFVNTNVIIGAYRTKSSGASVGTYQIETVEACILGRTVSRDWSSLMI